MRRVLPLVILAACANGAGQQGTEDAPAAPPDAPGTPLDAAIDATPPLFDAMPIDAAIDAAPCTPVAQQRLSNAGFDDMSTNPWQQHSVDQNYLPIVTTQDMAPAGVSPTSPANAVWLGGLLNASYVNEYVYQTVTIPPDATAISVSGDRWVQSNETLADRDVMSIELDDTQGVLLEVLATADGTQPDGGWVPFTLAPTGNYAGQQVRLRVAAKTDGSLNTNFFLDSLSFDLTACP